MLQIQLIYTWLEDKFYPDASLAERRSVEKRRGNGRSCTSAAVSFDTAYFHDTNYSHLQWGKILFVDIIPAQPETNQKSNQNLINQSTITNSHQLISIINSNIICAFCHRIRFLTEKQIDNSRREKYGIHAFYMVYPVCCCLIF